MNAAMRGFDSVSSSARNMRTAIRRIAGCCACAASAHTANPPTTPRNPAAACPPLSSEEGMVALPSNQGLDASLRGHLETNADIVTHITKPVRIDDIGALSAQSDQPILFENIVGKPGFRLCDILVKNRRSQARALGVDPAVYLKTLAYRLRQPPRGFKNLKSGPLKEWI